MLEKTVHRQKNAKQLNGDRIVRDVYDGELYEELESRKLVGAFMQFTVNWTVDGIDSGTGKKKKMWVMSATLNEVDSSCRSKWDGGSFVVGIFIGDKTMQVPVELMIELFKAQLDGINGERE